MINEVMERTTIELGHERILIVIPTWNHLQTTTEPCLESVVSSTDERSRIVCVDNGSEDDTPRFLEEMSRREGRVSWIEAGMNLGWARGSLRGLDELGRSESHFCLLNSDTIVTPRWLDKLLFHLGRYPGLSMVIPNEDRDDVASVCAESVRAGTPPPPLSAILARCEELEGDHSTQSRPCAPSGFCVLVDRRKEAPVREYLEKFERFQSGDLDWRRFFEERGLTCRVALDTYVYHTRSGSGGYDGYRR